MTKVKVGFFSLVELTEPGQHRAYNEWHQYDHLPEQFPIPGVAFGQRWVATPACQAARAATTDELGGIQYLTMYLMTEPTRETLNEFAEVGERLNQLGRFHRYRRSVRNGAWMAVDAVAAPGVPISGEALPWRPSTGIYVVVDDVSPDADPDALDRWISTTTTDEVPRMLAVDGVAGAWSFASSSRYRDPRWSTGRSRITVLWLDDDPVATAERLAPTLASRWPDGPVTPALAGPLCRIEPGQWGWFDETDDPSPRAP